MANRLKWGLLGGLVLSLSWTATSCSGVLPPALYPSPDDAAASLAPGTAVVSFRGEIVPVLRQHCASCHSTGGIGAAKLVMFDAAGEVQFATVRTRIRDMIGAVKDGRMPLGKPNSVPPGDVAKLEAWLAAGTPDTAAAGPPGAVTPPGASGAPTESPVPGATPSAPVGATPIPGATATTGAAPGTTLSYRTQVVPILRQHCASCHVTGGIGPFAMFDAGQEPVHPTIRTQLPAMITAIKNGRMPLGRPGTVPADQVATLEAWQAAGAPEADVTVPGAPAGGSATPTPAVAPTPVVVTPTPVAGFSPAPLPSVAGAVSFTAQVVPVLRQHCASCHVTGGIGSFSMFNAAGEPQFYTIQGRIGDMVNAIQAGRMPLGRPGTVPADQVAMLDAWRAAGAPGDGTGAAPNATPTPPSATQAPATAAPTATPGAVIPSAVPIDLTAVQFTRDVVPVLRQHCVACHVTGGFAPWAMFDTGGAPFFNNIKTRMPAMIDAIKTGRMPMNRPGTVSANHLGVLEAWQAAGGPADPAPPVGATPTPTPAPSIVPTVNNVSFRTHVVPILNQHCSACHTQGGQGAGKVRMFLSTGAADWAEINDEIDDMIEAIQDREMPLGRPGSVPAGQVQTLQNWATRGAPNN